MALEKQIAEFRDLRRRLEESVLPLATSVDGRRFELQASLHGLELRAGGYVVLESEGARRFGQLESLELQTVDGTEMASVVHSLRSEVRLRIAHGTGVVLGADGRPFHDARALPAAPADVQSWVKTNTPRRSAPVIGELSLAPGVPAIMDAGGFDRHTLLCGQSGSGKTYSLGLLLERLLLDTDLRIVILDPNSDFVHFDRLRPGVERPEAARHAAVAKQIRIMRAGAGLQLRLEELDDAARAAALALDPVADREEFALVGELLGDDEMTLEELMNATDPNVRALRLRVTNLGLDRWELLARGRPGSVVAELEREDVRCLVIDLGSLATREEQAVAAEAVLASLWRRRADRNPVLVVIDEAHNVCPQEPADPLTALASEHAERIAGEGRKFGLYLLVATQRPQKVHENVLTQCDNLVLMRMNSPADLAYVGATFSLVPPSLLEQARSFRQGEALAAGKIVSHPSFIRFGTRLTQEGGADIPADWARPD